MVSMERNIVAWVDNFCGRFEAFREENMNEGPVRYVEDRVKTVGTRVKKFCSDMIKDSEGSGDGEESILHHHSPKEDSSFFKKIYSDVKKELTDLVIDDVRAKPQENMNRIILNGDCIITPDFDNTESDSDWLSNRDDERSESDSSVNEESNEYSLLKKLYSELKKELSELIVDDDEPEDARANINRMILNGDSIITPDFEKNTDANNEFLSLRDEKIELSVYDYDDDVTEQFEVDNINRMILNGGTAVTPDFENNTDSGSKLLLSYDQVTGRDTPAAVSATADDTAEKSQADINRMILNNGESSISSKCENTDEVTKLDQSELEAKQDGNDDDHHHLETNAGISDSSQQSYHECEASVVPGESEACKSSQTSIEGWIFDGPVSEWDLGGRDYTGADDEEETVVGDEYEEGMMMKLGESCVIVDKLEEVAVQGQKRRSYKKKIRDVLYLRRWANKNNSKKIGVEAGDYAHMSEEEVKVEGRKLEREDPEWELI